MTSVNKAVSKHSELTGVGSSDHHSKYSMTTIASGTTSINHDAYTTLVSGGLSNEFLFNGILKRPSGQTGACRPVWYVNSGTPEMRVREENQGGGDIHWELLQP